MKTKSLVLALIIAAIFMITSLPAAATSADTALGLVSMLTKELDVSTEQATGGAGAILGYAKEQLGADDFTQVADAIPGIDGILDAAPKAGALGQLAKLGGSATSGTSLGGLASLAGAFSGLNLDSGMIGKFVPVILDYVESSGGKEVMNLLAGVLK